MRKFNVVVDSNDEVDCDHYEMHVRPKYEETFGVYLDPKLVKKYKLEVDIDPDADFPLKKDKVTDKSVELIDACGSRGEAKFTVRLEPQAGATPVKELDPIVVNE